MRLGVCYYPEQWPRDRWPIDARKMRDLGIDLVRIGEFAWTAIEPAEGQFVWEWLDTAIEILSTAGHALVLGTPTAAPPAWLSQKYPNTLPVDEHGRRRNFGGRRHYCPNSKDYQDLSNRIVTALADRYGTSQAVIGWQIDNEFGGGRTARCYCDNCVVAFWNWLARRYESIEVLNQAWGTVFWSQTYTAWDQIGAPVGTGSPANPSQQLDYRRFASASWAAYQKEQFEILRTHADLPRQFITHNLMGLFFTEIDYHELAADLDFVSLDHYPTGGIDRIRDHLYVEESTPRHLPPDAGDPYLSGLELDLTRGVKGRPFWIMEMQPGHINWSKFNSAIRPEMVRLWAWQAAAQGAETLVFFRWRASLFAQEQYHEGILQHDGSPGTAHDALELVNQEWQRLRDFTARPFRSETAILFNYENLWALQIQPHRNGFQYLTHLFRLYRALRDLGVPVDVLPHAADMSQYAIVIAPMLHLEDKALAHKLEAFARRGGTVLLTVRSGFKTRSNRVTDEPLPGVYRQLAGIRVQKWAGLAPGVQYDVESQIAGLSGEAAIWAESLALEDAEAIAHYKTGTFAGQAALTENQLGSGRVLYLGWHPTENQARALLAALCQDAGVTHLTVPLDPGLLAFKRDGTTLLINFSETQRSTELEGGQKVSVPPLDLILVEK